MKSPPSRRFALPVVVGLFGFVLRAGAESFPLPGEGSDVIGAMLTVTTVQGDTLLDVARRHGLGYEEIGNANPGVDPWLPGAGVEIGLPKPVTERGLQAWLARVFLRGLIQPFSLTVRLANKRVLGTTAPMAAFAR